MRADNLDNAPPKGVLTQCLNHPLNINDAKSDAGSISNSNILQIIRRFALLATRLLIEYSRAGECPVARDFQATVLSLALQLLVDEVYYRRCNLIGERTICSLSLILRSR